MTHRPEAVLGRHLIIRWRLLAERRLQYLTDLRESGRWCRYYGEAALAADIRDTQRAVAAWRLLAPPEAAERAEAAEHAVPLAAAAGLRTTLPPIAFVAQAPAGIGWSAR